MIIQPCEMKSLRDAGYYEGRLSNWQSYVLGHSRGDVLDLLFTALKVKILYGKSSNNLE